MNSDHDPADHYSDRSFAMREAFEERLAIMLVDGQLEFEHARRIAFALIYDPPLAALLRSATQQEMIILTDPRRPRVHLGASHSQTTTRSAASRGSAGGTAASTRKVVEIACAP